MQDKKENSKQAGKPIASIPYQSKAWTKVGRLSRSLCLASLAFGDEGLQEYQTANGAPCLREEIAIAQNGTLSKILIGIMLLPLLGGQAASSLAAGLAENRLDASELGAAVSNAATFTAAWSPAFLAELSSKGEDTENCIWVGDCE